MLLYAIGRGPYDYAGILRRLHGCADDPRTLADVAAMETARMQQCHSGVPPAVDVDQQRIFLVLVRCCYLSAFSPACCAILCRLQSWEMATASSAACH